MFRRLVVRPTVQTRSMFIQTETTPNPHSLKFTPGVEVLPEEYGTGMYFEKHQAKDIQKSPLAKALFAVDGIKGVFFAREVITITKTTDATWNLLKPQVFTEVLNFYGSEDPRVMLDAADSDAVSDTTILDTDSEVVAMIKELMETRVRPAVQDDGGDIFFEGFDENTGIVKVRLAGSCVGCPSSSITLRNGVENMLQHYIAEVKGIEEVGNEDDDAVYDSEMKLSYTPNTHA